MNIQLPDGFVIGPTKRRQQKVMHNLMGDEWQVAVYYQGNPSVPAFEIAKQFDMRLWQPRFAGRIGNGAWVQFDNLNTMLKVMSAKYRVGVRHD